MSGSGQEGDRNPDSYRAQYEWYPGDFQNRDMLRVDTLIHTGPQPLAPDSELVRRAHSVGANL